MTLTFKFQIVIILKNCILFLSDLSDLPIVKNSNTAEQISYFLNSSPYLTLSVVEFYFFASTNQLLESSLNGFTEFI